MQRFRSVFYLLIFVVLSAGCSQEQQTSPTAFKPINADAAVFWDRQTTQNADILGRLAEEFNSSWSGLPIQIEHTGGYPDIYRKVTASIQARVLPAMAAAYPSMTNEYIRSGAVVALDLREATLDLGSNDGFVIANGLLDVFTAGDAVRPEN